MKMVLIDISNHGFGHLSQMAPIVDRLHSGFPSVRLILRTVHSEKNIREFTRAKAEILAPPPEATMISHSANDLDLDRSAKAYSELHANWAGFVEDEQRTLRNLKPSLVVSNVNPLSLTAAGRAGIPTVGICCMNWRDIYSHYFSHRPEARTIISRMTRAYAGSDVFLQPQPHMPMTEIPRRRPIGPIARKGRSYREDLWRRLAIPRECKIAFLTLGGLPDPQPLRLPVIPGVHWLMRRALVQDRSDISPIEELGLTPLDIIASSDVVICKDSYCSVVETAAAGVGLVVVPRDGWPEADCIADWASNHCNFAIAPRAFHDPETLRRSVEQVLNGKPMPPIHATGVEEAVSVIAELGAL